MPNYENHNNSYNNSYEFYNNSDDNFNDDNSLEYYRDESGMNDLYEPEEQSRTKYNLINYEIYNPNIHGETDSSIYTHLLVCDRYKNLNNIEGIINHGDYINRITNLNLLSTANSNHPFIRNYRNILTINAGKIEIAHCIYLDTSEMVAILKTFWLKIIQRKWKSVFIERKMIKRLRMRIASVIYKEINGKWPPECEYMPSLEGMLSDLY